MSHHKEQNTRIPKLSLVSRHNRGMLRHTLEVGTEVKQTRDRVTTQALGVTTPNLYGKELRSKGILVRTMYFYIKMPADLGLRTMVNPNSINRLIRHLFRDNFHNLEFSCNLLFSFQFL